VSVPIVNNFRYPLVVSADCAGIVFNGKVVGTSFVTAKERIDSQPRPGSLVATTSPDAPPTSQPLAPLRATVAGAPEAGFEKEEAEEGPSTPSGAASSPTVGGDADPQVLLLGEGLGHDIMLIPGRRSATVVITFQPMKPGMYAFACCCRRPVVPGCSHDGDHRVSRVLRQVSCHTQCCGCYSSITSPPSTA